MRNIFKLLGYILLIFFFFLGISKQLSAQKIYTGTGFALNNGYLVTNWHVVKNKQTIHVYGIRGDFTKKYIAEVVAKDEDSDLAILKISGNGFPGFGTIPYKIKTNTAEVAENVWVVGFPEADIMGEEVKYSEGVINSRSGIGGDKSTYQISAQVSHGSSGSPVFDDYGNLIGIVSSGLDASVQQNVYYAIKTSYLKNLVETMYVSNILPTNSLMGNYAKRQDKFKAVKNFVFYIVCYDIKMPLDDVVNRPSYINVSPTSLYFSENQESKTLSVSTNAQSWKVSSSPDWCTTSGKTAKSVTINATMNPSYENRSGTIVLETNDGKTMSVYVSQSGKERPYITANPKSINLNYIGGEREISISTNSESWKISSKPDWCTIYKALESLTINVSKNESYEFRNGVVELETSDGISISIYVSQSGKGRPYIRTNPTSLIFYEYKGGQNDISISTNSESWKVLTKPDWCEISNSSVSTATINVSGNNSYDSRSGNIVLETNDGVTVSISVSQSGKERPYITANPTSVNFIDLEGNRTISISTNSESWKVSSCPTWCSTSISTWNKQTITINTTNNTSHNSRDGKIVLETNDGAKVSISVSQSGKPKVSTFLGLNLGIGYQGNGAFQSLNGSAGIDLEWGRNYNAYGLFLSYRSIDNISFGPLFIWGNFIMGIGANINIGRNIYSGLPVGVQSRKIDMGYDGVLRLGGRVGRFYMFAEGGLGKIGGVDNFYDEYTQCTESHEWSKLNWRASLGLGLQIIGNVTYNNGPLSKNKIDKTKKYTGISKSYSHQRFSFEDYYDNIGTWGVTWVKAYGFSGIIIYDKYDCEFNYGGTFDLLAIRIRMFEFSLASFGYDEYVGGWDWTPRLRLNMPMWDSGSTFTDFGMHMWSRMIEGFFIQFGVQWMYKDWGYVEAFLRGVYDFKLCNYGCAISAGLSFGLCTNKH